MESYRLAPVGVIRLSDGATITRGDAGWLDYQAQVASGYVPQPMQVAEVPLAERQAAAWSRIQERRDATKGGGVHVFGKWFHSDDPSRIQQLGLVMMGAAMPAGIEWKTMDGSFIEMTPALASQIFAAVAALDLAAFAAAEVHKAAMLASADPEAYDFSAGWPEVFA